MCSWTCCKESHSNTHSFDCPIKYNAKMTCLTCFNRLGQNLSDQVIKHAWTCILVLHFGLAFWSCIILYYCLACNAKMICLTCFNRLGHNFSDQMIKLFALTFWSCINLYYFLVLDTKLICLSAWYTLIDWITISQMNGLNMFGLAFSSCILVLHFDLAFWSSYESYQCWKKWQMTQCNAFALEEFLLLFFGLRGQKNQWHVLDIKVWWVL